MLATVVITPGPGGGTSVTGTMSSWYHSYDPYEIVIFGQLWTRRYTEIHRLLDNRSTGSVVTTCGTTVRTPMKSSSSVNCSNRENTVISAPIHINCKEIQRPPHMHTRCGTTVQIHMTLSSLASCDPIKSRISMINSTFVNKTKVGDWFDTFSKSIWIINCAKTSNWVSEDSHDPYEIVIFGQL